MYTAAGTAKLMELLEAKLEEANEVLDFSLGHSNVIAAVHKSTKLVGEAVAATHITTKDEATALRDLRARYFPTEACKVPSTIMPMLLRAIASRNVKLEPEEVGCDSKGNPQPL